jgi:hypothetical protein
MPSVSSTRRRAVPFLVAAALVVAPLTSAHADEEQAEPSISGIVTSTGTAVNDVSVRAYDADGEIVAGTRTDRTGSYSLAVPANASYRLGFVDDERQVFRTEYWNDQSTLGAATPIVVGASDATGKDADLARNPQVRGTVTTENLDEIENVAITVFRLVDGTYEEQAQFYSGVDGRYRVPVESGGTYKFRFTSSKYQTEWLDDVATEAAATPIQVTSNVTGKDVRLSRRAAVTGTVSGPDGPAPYARIIAYQQQEFGWSEVESTSAKADGSYSLGLAPGEYRLGFTSGTRLMPEFYDNSPTLAGAQVITIGSTGQTIDATLDAQPVIRGTVRSDSDGTPLKDVSVSGSIRRGTGSFAFWEGIASATTAADGTYELPGPQGTYRLSFGGGADYGHEYYSDATDFEDATPVVLGSGGATADASLSRNPTISGVVSGPNGDALASIQVTLDTEIAPGQWRTYFEARTAADGRYSITAPPRTYRLRFRDDKGARYQTQYLGGATTQDAADPFDLTADVQGADAQLVQQVALTGRVTTSGGAPAAGVKVVAYDAVNAGVDLAEVAISTVTSASGDYSLALEQGSYRLRFVPPTLGQRPEFWKDVAAFNDAELIDIGGAVKAGVDAQLEVGSGVTGTVSVPEGQDRIFVIVYKRDADGGWSYAEEADVVNGTFDVPLPAGTYRVKYEHGDFDPIYYGGSATFGGSEDVSIATGEVVDLGGVTFGGTGAVTNVVPPAVTGDAAVGDVLRASDGQWGPSAGAVTLSRQWLRDGVPIDGATGASYSVARGDEGARIAVQVKGVQDGLLSRSKTSAQTAPVAQASVVTPPVVGPPAPSAAAKIKPSIKVSAKAGKKSATLEVTVKASGVTPSGKVAIKLGGKKLTTVTLKRGRATIKLKKLKKGKRSFTIVYSGDSRVLAKTVTSKKISIK